ncbi:DUF302 domain-containing protein, partial [endosymbiont of Riftia pachyptila]
MYEFHTELDLPFDEAVERVKATLMEEHLGIVSEVDVQAILKAKIDKAIPNYRIFGACNPKLADRIISEEPNAGTLLPCNFIMRESETGQVVVSFMDPVAVLGLAESDAAKSVAE